MKTTRDLVDRNGIIRYEAYTSACLMGRYLRALRALGIRCGAWGWSESRRKRNATEVAMQKLSACPEALS